MLLLYTYRRKRRDQHEQYAELDSGRKHAILASIRLSETRKKRLLQAQEGKESKELRHQHKLSQRRAGKVS